MSLDVYLKQTGAQLIHTGTGIFVREDGANREISLAEYQERYPGREPLVIEADYESDEVYSANITHNLNKMASEAGIYEYLWRPDEVGITKASQLIAPLDGGLTWLRSNPDKFKAFNPGNGWGSYDGLVDFVAAYLAACEKYPDADVLVSR